MSKYGTKNYALTVCFATLMCGAITTGFLLFNFIKLAAPDLTIDPALTQFYESNEAYRNAPFHRTMMVNPAVSMAPGGRHLQSEQGRSKQNIGAELNDKKVERLRMEQLETVYTRHKYRAVQGITLQAIMLLICAILFLLHWKLHNRHSYDANT